MVLQFLRLCVITGLVGVATVVAGRTAEDQRRVSVSVITDANVNEKTILYAERVASYIYQGPVCRFLGRNTFHTLSADGRMPRSATFTRGRK